MGHPDAMDRYLAEEALKLAEEKYAASRQRWLSFAAELEREEQYMTNVARDIDRLRQYLDK